MLVLFQSIITRYLLLGISINSFRKYVRFSVLLCAVLPFHSYQRFENVLSNYQFRSVYMSVYRSVYLFYYLSTCLPACLPTCLSVCLSICLSSCLSLFLSDCLSVYLSSCCPQPAKWTLKIERFVRF